MSAANSKKTAKGRRVPGRPWKPGESGNVKGRPKIPAEVIEACRLHTQAAVETIVALMKSADSDSVRLHAAEAIINRAWGKPIEHHEQTGNVTIAVKIDPTFFGAVIHDAD